MSQVIPYITGVQGLFMEPLFFIIPINYLPNNIKIGIMIIFGTTASSTER